MGLESDQFDVEILETQKNSLFKKGYVRIRVQTDDEVKQAPSDSEGSFANAKRVFADPLPQDEFEKRLVEFVSEMIQKMGYEVKVEVLFREEHKIGIKLNSPSSSILIGRKGKNLGQKTISCSLLYFSFAGSRP